MRENGTHIGRGMRTNNVGYQLKGDISMSDKMIGVTKAAMAGAFFGSAVGMVAVPKTKKGKKDSSLKLRFRQRTCLLKVSLRPIL